MELPKNVGRVTATSLVVNTIREAIQKGKLKVGDKLPNETELAKEIGVGRSSFREGIRILAAYGVVEVRQGEGTFIVNKISEQILEFLGFFPSRQNLLYLVELRRIIEVGNIIEIRDNLTAEDLKQLEDCVEVMKKFSSREEVRTADSKFHDTLLKKSQNPILREMVGMLKTMQDRLSDDYSQYEDITLGSIPYHQELLEAVKDKDILRCVEAFKEHFAATEDFVRNRYQE